MLRPQFLGLYSTFNREVLKIWKPVRLIENSIVIVNILVSIKRTGFKIFKTVRLIESLENFANQYV